MSQERNFGVTEAGLGLTVITCLLVALGYWIVHRLVGSAATPPVEIRASTTDEDPSDGAEPVVSSQQPLVLPAEQPQSADAQLPHTANRPQWLPYEEESDEAAALDDDSILSPRSPDAGQSIWPAVEPDSQQVELWPEPLQVR